MAITLFASITGAWIETTNIPKGIDRHISRPSRARGLKQLLTLALD